MRSFPSRKDHLFLRDGFETAGEFNFPLIKRQNVDLQNISLIPFHLTQPHDVKNKNCGVHFFLDDYRFECVYSKPEISQNRMLGYKFRLTPDFSEYREMDRWRLVENTGKSRWCGAYWQSKGEVVIPTISWAGLSTINICTSAIEKECVIAVCTVGCKMSKFDFLTCYNRALEIVEPPKILCVGEPFEKMDGDIICVAYSRSSKIITNKCLIANRDLCRNDQLEIPFEEYAG